MQAFFEFGKVKGCESDYIMSQNPGSYVDTSEGSATKDIQGNKSSRKMYDLIDPLEDFFLNLKFIDLNLFKN